MGTVIYSASPLQAMLSSLLTLLFVLGLGVVGVLAGIFRKSQSKGARIGMGVAGGFLILVGCIWGAITVLSLSSGAQTVAAHVNNKRVAEETCGQESESTCTHYVMETTAGAVSYDFVVPQAAYDQVQVNSCYQVTFYKSKSPFVVAADTDTYHRVEAVTRIEVADPSACG